MNFKFSAVAMAAAVLLSTDKRLEIASVTKILSLDLFRMSSKLVYWFLIFYFYVRLYLRLQKHLEMNADFKTPYSCIVHTCLSEHPGPYLSVN